MAEPTRYFGKYRGTVVDNNDPLRQGRLTAQVPDVLGDTPCTWALPCLPVAGQQMGVFVLPLIGSGVWMEFEQGDINYPVWTGCWYAAASEVPTDALTGPPASPNILLRTAGGHEVLITDAPGGTGISLSTLTGAKIQVAETGIVIDNGRGASISLTNNQVDINHGALVVS